MFAGPPLQTCVFCRTRRPGVTGVVVMFGLCSGPPCSLCLRSGSSGLVLAWLKERVHAGEPGAGRRGLAGT